MNSKFLLLSAAVAATASALRSAPLESYSYEQWLEDFQGYGIRSSSRDYAKRKLVFNRNIAMIREHNKQAARGMHSWTMDVNKFADMTEQEFVSIYTGYDQAERVFGQTEHVLNGLYGLNQKNDDSTIPTSVDWVANGTVGAVKNQGGCGSCWAFAAATTLEAHTVIETGVNVTLSTQQLTSCTPNPRKCGGTGGCKGATAQLAFDYAAHAAITSEELYPYTSGTNRQTGECEYDPIRTPPVISIKSHVNLRPNDKTELLRAIAEKGPVSVSVAAGRFMFYRGGIFDGCSSANDAVINHAVVAVGYDITDPNNSYLTIRNSWGAAWGEEGNIRLRINGGTGKEDCLWDTNPAAGSACEGETDPVLVCGECGVFSDSSFATGIEAL